MKALSWRRPGHEVSIEKIDELERALGSVLPDRHRDMLKTQSGAANADYCEFNVMVEGQSTGASIEILLSGDPDEEYSILY